MVIMLPKRAYTKKYANSEVSKRYHKFMRVGNHFHQPLPSSKSLARRKKKIVRAMYAPYGQNEVLPAPY